MIYSPYRLIFAIYSLLFKRTFLFFYNAYPQYFECVELRRASLKPSLPSNKHARRKRSARDCGFTRCKVNSAFERDDVAAAQEPFRRSDTNVCEYACESFALRTWEANSGF